MKKLLAIIICLPLCVFAQVPPPAPASSADVTAGTATYKFISPAALAAAGLVSYPTNGITAATATNIATYQVDNRTLPGANIGVGSVTTNKVDAAFYNLLTNTASGGSGGSGLQTGNTTDATNINLTVTGTLNAADQTVTTLSAAAAYLNLTNVGLTTDGDGKIVGTNGVTQSGLAAGSYPQNLTLATNLVGTSSTYGRSKKVNEFPWTLGVIRSNLPLRVLLLGDSVTAANETSQGLRYKFDQKMVRGGFGSIFGDDYAVGQDSGQLFYQSGGLSYTGTDSHTKQYHFHLSNGQQYTSAGIEVLANKLTIHYAADAALGTMLVETQALGGSYGTLATIDSAVGTGNKTTNFTWSSVQYTRFRITSTGNNVLLNVGLMDTTEQRSHTWANISVAGDVVTNLVYDPFFYQFYTNYSPQLVIVEAKDFWYDFYPGLEWLRQVVTNADLIIVAPSPNSADGGVPAQCDLIFNYVGTNNNISAFDKNSLFQPTNYWIPKNYTDSAHLNVHGVARASAAFADWFGDAGFELGGKTNIQYFSVFDTRLISAGAIQTTVPELLNEVYYGGSTLWNHGWRMSSGATRSVGLYIPSALVVGKKNIAISQTWLTTNAQLIAHQAVISRLGYLEAGRREKIGNAGGNVLTALTGTNLVTYRVLSSFTQPCRDGDMIFAELGHGGTLTNAIFWLGAKVEAY